MTIDKGREGRCYELAARFVSKNEGCVLVYGSAELGVEGKRIDHAWVETDGGFIWEPITDGFYEPDAFNRRVKPIVKKRISYEETVRQVQRNPNSDQWIIR